MLYAECVPIKNRTYCELVCGFSGILEIEKGRRTKTYYSNILSLFDLFHPTDKLM